MPSRTVVRRLGDNIKRDIGIPLGILEGRNPLGSDGGVYSAFSYFGRVALRASMLDKLGSVIWSQFNDLAPLSLAMLAGPRRLAFIPRALFNLKSLPKRDLEVLGLATEGIARTRALADTDALSTHMGFGEGITRKLSAQVEAGAEGLSDLHSRVSLMRWFTDKTKSVAGMVVIDKLTDGARRIIRADDLVAGGMKKAAAMEKAGLDSFTAGWLNKIGLNSERARAYINLVYEHGLDAKDNPLRNLPRDHFMGTPTAAPAFNSQVIKPNFAEWDFAKPGTRDLFDILTANVGAEVNRSMVVTPGAFDRPVINQRLIGRMFNQFQAFASAFANQRMRVVAQGPAHHQLGIIMAYLGLGAISDAISNDLSGRRSIDETMKLWQTNPTGMVYASFKRSGLDGWLGRAFSVADAMGIPFSPGNFTGNPTSSSANAHVSSKSPLTYLGPTFADLDQVLTLGGKMGRGEFDKKTGYMAAKLAPFQNLVWLRLLHRATGAPVIPEALIEDRQQRQEARP